MPNVQWKTPDDRQRNCPKHVEFRTGINLEISASVGFIVKKFLMMHGHMKVKFDLFMIYSFYRFQLPDTKLRSGWLGNVVSPSMWFPFER